MADDVQPPRKRLAALGFGVTALVCAVAVGEYGALAASRPNCVGGCSLGTVGTASAWAAAAVAAGLLITVWWIRRATDDEDRCERIDVLRGMVWTALAILMVSALLAKVWAVLAGAAELGPATTQLSMAAVAAGLATFGMLAVSVGAPVLAQAHLSPLPRAAIAGCVTSLVFSAALTAVAWRVGDDRWYVDASTAADTAMPAVPAQFGQLRFHLQLSQTPAVAGAPQVSVLQAGAGFVLWDSGADTLVAYDSSGRERWHYRRAGPGTVHVGAVRVYDEGRTLVLVTMPTMLRYDANPTLVAVDAVTGQPLWSASSDALSAAVGYKGSGKFRYSQHFVARQAQSWTGFNPRTGQLIWQIPNPLSCDEYAGSWDTASRLVAVQNCSADRRLHYRMVTVDPETGRTVLNRAILTMPIDEPSEDQRYSTDVRRVGGSGISVSVRPPGQQQDSTAYVNADTGVAVDLGDEYLRTDSGAAGGFFVHHYPARSVTMYGPDGLPRCEFPEELNPTLAGANDGAVAWLSQQLAYPVSEGESRTVLKVADRNDCRIVASLPIPGRVRDLTAAAGVTVVLYTDAAGVYLNGYAP